MHTPSMSIRVMSRWDLFEFRRESLRKQTIYSKWEVNRHYRLNKSLHIYSVKNVREKPFKCGTRTIGATLRPVLSKTPDVLPLLGWPTFYFKEEF